MRPSMQATQAFRGGGAAKVGRLMTPKQHEEAARPSSAARLHSTSLDADLPRS